jgi:hypothetical protein
MRKIQLVSVSQFAKELGISRQRVYKLIEKGIITRRKDGKIDLEKERKVWEDKRDTLLKPVREITKGYTYYRTLSEKYKSELAELEVRKARGELIEIQKVIEDGQKILMVFKTRMLAIPSKISPLLAGEKSAKKVHSIISNEINLTLNELSQLKEV